MASSRLPPAFQVLGDLRGAAGNLADIGDDLLDCLHNPSGPLLNKRDLARDLFRRGRCLSCERLDFSGDDLKSLACFACPGRLDCGIECQKIGLIGNRVDQGKRSHRSIWKFQQGLRSRHLPSPHSDLPPGQCPWLPWHAG